MSFPRPERLSALDGAATPSAPIARATRRGIRHLRLARARAEVALGRLPSSRWIRYGFAFLLTGTALAATLVAGERIERTILIFLLPAAMVSALVGGLGPGLVATVVTLALGAQRMSPSVRLFPPPLEVAIPLVIVLVTTFLLGAANGALRRTSEVAAQRRRKLAEKAVANARLAAELERRNRDLLEATHVAERARADAERASRARSDLIAMMSHELRTPLNAIVGYAELLGGGISGPVSPEQEHQLGRIRMSAAHVLGLIDELLTFARLEANRETLVVEHVDVHEVAEEALTMVAPLAHQKQLVVSGTLPGHGILIESDRRKLRQILLNLLSNAVKYTEHGQVQLIVEPLAREAVFRVTDTGIGISHEDLLRIWDPYWRAEGAAVDGDGASPGDTCPRGRDGSGGPGGAGLGLTVTVRLVSLLGGAVNVESAPGRGSTFIVRIPRPDVADLSLAGQHTAS